MRFNNELIDWPLDTNIIRKNSESNTFGIVRKNLDGTPRAHQGWDFYAKKDTKCYSISKGVVKFAGFRGALGNLVIISIGDTGYYAAYAHLSKINVVLNDTVKLGQLIGLTGNTGNASYMTGPNEHLHFEIREDVITGIGLVKRISPMQVFGVCPLKIPQFREFE